MLTVDSGTLAATMRIARTHSRSLVSSSAMLYRLHSCTTAWIENRPVSSMLFTSEYSASTPTASRNESSSATRASSSSCSPTTCSGSSLYASINSYDISPGCKNAHWSRSIAALGSTVRTCSYDIFHVVNTLLSAYSCSGYRSWYAISLSHVFS